LLKARFRRHRLHLPHDGKTKPLPPLRAVCPLTHLHRRLISVAHRLHPQTEWNHHRHRLTEWPRRRLPTGWLRHLRPKTEEPLRCLCV
jgi:hypothetical protein